ncbi:hypothetical protein EsDP_00004490 [Epichloe bromicola]|uniref:Carboxy-cis,cis-muconate cyclase n=1 Tax=Epichloe bromicola TaxID=79588 RepID=A0ABQ0CRZ4_9HYPO
MFKQLLALAGVAAAASLPRNGDMAAFARDAPQSKILMSNGSNLLLADFDGAKFNIVLQKNVPIAATWLVYARPDRLYAVDENNQTSTLFGIDVAGNKIEQKTTTQASSGVVHLALSKTGDRMVGAGYGAGSIDVYDTSAGGLKFLKSINSTGGQQQQQKKAHPHQAVLDPTGRFFIVNDLGMNELLLLDSTNDSFDIINRVPVEPAGCGPRHGAFFPFGAAQPTHYIVLCETKNLVNFYSLQYVGGKGIDFRREQSLSTFSGDVPAKAAAGELVVAPDNRNVYISNRLSGATDSIANFRVVEQSANASSSSACTHAAATTRLELVGLTSTGGTLPRMFSFANDGQTLLVGNQGGDLAVVALKRNQDGTLAEKPVASIASSAFPGGKGPAYIQQIA